MFIFISKMIFNLFVQDSLLTFQCDLSATFLATNGLPNATFAEFDGLGQVTVFLGPIQVSVEGQSVLILQFEHHSAVLCVILGIVGIYASRSGTVGVQTWNWQKIFSLACWKSKNVTSQGVMILKFTWFCLGKICRACISMCLTCRNLLISTSIRNLTHNSLPTFIQCMAGFWRLIEVCWRVHTVFSHGWQRVWFFFFVLGREDTLYQVHPRVQRIVFAGHEHAADATAHSC